MRSISWLLLLIFTFQIGAVQAQEPLKLIARSQELLPDPGLLQEEWRWLRAHRKFRLAVWLPMSPPYDITTGLNDYGGINADFLGLIERSLGIEIDVIRFPDYAAARDALQKGNADFIAQAGDNQLKDGMLLSTPYSINEAVEVINTDSEETELPKRIAVEDSYSDTQVLAHYPNAQRVKFYSSRHAMEALAFRQIDLFYCDEITARYLLSQSNFGNLRIRPSSHPLTGSGFSFAVMPEHKIWVDILNKVLKVVPDSVRVEIHRRWNGGIPLSLSEQQPVFTSLEHKWIRENEHIRVAVAEDNAPVAWFNASGQLRGIIADILTALKLRTGLTFDIQRYPGQQAALMAVKEGKADLVAGGIQDDIWRVDLITTRTWLYNSWVMVGHRTRDEAAIDSTIFSLDGQSPDAWLREQTLGKDTKVTSWRQGLDRVLRKTSDMMAMPLIVANAFLSEKTYSSLHILAGIDIDPMRYSFGASEQSWPLITILNKTMINIPPEDLHALTRGASVGNGLAVIPRPTNLSWPFLAGYGFAGLLLTLAIWYGYRYLRSRLSLQMEKIPFPLFICDPRGVVKRVNRAFCDGLSVSRYSVEGRPLTEILGVDSLTEHSEQRLHYQDRLLRIWRVPLGTRRGYAGGWIDETRQLTFIKKLRRSKRYADEASRAKSDFLITMSHEIRTPVSAIISMLELMRKRADDVQQNTRSIQVVWDAAQSLLLLIGNILDVSRIEAGRLVLRPERVVLRELIEDAALLFEELANQKALTFRLEIDTEIQGDVLADRSRLRQILVNLVGNAIKYTDRGSVVLRFDKIEKESGYLLLGIHVEDTGSGIDKRTLSHIFQPFVQGENSRKVQGSGLGLYICRSLAEMMGGSIDLQSEPGQGTLVTVMLKFLVMPPQTAPAPLRQKEKPKGPLNILVVDDNPAGRMLLIEQLRWLGHHAVDAETLKQVLTSVENNQPDVIFTDCNMPGGDGFTLAGIILARWPDTIIYGITADAREVIREKARASGMSDCFFKPMSLSVLTELLGDISTVPSVTVASEGEETSDLPATLLEGENLDIFLSLQISVIDEALHQLARWHQDKQTPLGETLHKLRGGILLLGIADPTACCELRGQQTDSKEIRRLETEINQLRDALIRWQETGLQPNRTVLQDNTKASV
ncbi:transporter substrate-binding domain-containing protein [uncultured Cedecea sp.]|uniref:ATP-binding protein n=1 Tax=uncultured Cedecea sp. TaxID=988762 RepID=UPI00260CD90F|nr:transporter substrate-binding domain-containing protein [uncultured Cedecea sp.]